MFIKLATNEKVIKKYDYATTQEGIINKRTTEQSLIVTDRRVVKVESCDKVGYQKKNVSEIPVDSITGVHAKSSSSFKFSYLVWGIISAIVGLMMLFTGDSDDKETASVIFGIVLVALAAFLIYLFVKSRRNVLICNFVVADRTNHALNLGGVSTNTLFGRFANFHSMGHSKFIKIVVDAKVADELVREIGALLIDIKSGNPVSAEAEPSAVL